MSKYTTGQFRDNLKKALDQADRGELVEIERSPNYGTKGKIVKKIYVVVKKAETYNVKVKSEVDYPRVYPIAKK